MDNLFEIFKIGTLDGLIWFPFVFGVGLIYKHQKIIDVSIDGIAILSGITCALVWTLSQSYVLSGIASIICGIFCYTLLWISINKLQINSMLAGILFSIIAYAISVLIVGESLVLTGTNLFPSFTTFSVLPLIIALIVGIGAELFYKTNIGTLIRFTGETQIPNIKINPNLLRWLGFVVTAIIVGIGSTIYVHKQGVARSGVGFEFLITSLSSFLLIDRLVELINKGITKTRTKLSKRNTFIISNILQSVAFKALIGSIFFQILVLIIIANTPNPVYWKLFFGLVLVFCVAHPQINLSSSNNSAIESDKKSSMGVELKDAAIAYDLGFDKRTVFDSLNVSFDKGINYVWGQNGSGKSSLLNCIQGSIKIQKGKITINNDDVTNNPPHKRSIFLLSQNPFKSIASELPVYENLIVANSDKNNNHLGFYFYDKIIEDLDHSLALSELSYLTSDDDNLFLQNTKNLSGGQAQRVLFYMALLSKDEVILADEPSSGLDIENLNRLVSIFEKLSLMGKTIIIATHDNRLSKMKGKHYVIKEQSIGLLN